MAPRALILPSTQINWPQWDACIAAHQHGLIYSTTAYLNAMADNWHGIVIDDYRAVMPIAWRMKWGIRYAYMPAFMQQTGLTGNFDAHDLKSVINTLSGFVKLADINFNYSNTDLATIVPCATRSNFVIDLSVGYGQMFANYRKDLRENIRRASHRGLRIQTGTVEAAIEAYRQAYGRRMSHVSPNDYARFAILCKQLAATGNVQVNVMTDGQQLLLDHLLQQFAAQEKFFDFEGSELPGVKEFYKKFGATNQCYYHYHLNRLPWPLTLFRR